MGRAMAVDYRTNTSQDGITADELALYNLIMAYRASLGLPDIPLSKSLSIVAGRHVLDDVENEGAYDGHAWSDAPYNGADPSTYPNMWEMPQRLGTPYPGYGFEISTGFVGEGAIATNHMDPTRALQGWQGSPGHNDVITNAGPWDEPWGAIGIGMYKGVAHVWFGREADPAGAPALPGGQPPPSTPGLNVFVTDYAQGDVTLQFNGDHLILQGTSFTFVLDNYEQYDRVTFTDAVLAFDDDGNAGIAYRLYQAAFDRTPDDAGLAFWIGELDGGASALAVSAGFAASAEFIALFGTSPNTIIAGLYENVLGRAGEPAGIDYWVGQLSAGASTGEVLLGFSESDENVALVAPAISEGIWIV
jgi:hypothetical protein